MINQIEIGWASTSITPDRPAYLQGQIYYRISSYIHDPITATALVLANGEEHVVFLSADMVSVEENLYAAVCRNVDGYEGIDASKIIISATHSHNSIGTTDIIFGESQSMLDLQIVPEIEKPENLMSNDEVLGFLTEKFSFLIKDAWKARKPGELGISSDYAVAGFNRRPQFVLENGTVESIMYGDCSKKEFLRFEGTADHSIGMLYTWDANRNLTGVLVNVPCPAQVFELHYFVSADYWTYVRMAVSEKLGDIFVLPLCGAAGDQNPLDLVRISKNNEKELRKWNAQAGEVFRNFDMTEECIDIGERIVEAIYRGKKKAEKNIQARPVFRHFRESIELPIRKVAETDYREADVQVKKILGEFSAQRLMQNKDLVGLFEPLGIVSRWKMQRKTGTIKVRSNIVRIADAAFCTNPFELFVEYAIRIRARAKASHVFVCQLANGSLGYLPTEAAIAGGSYSSKPASTIVGPEGGNILVETLIRALDKLWD